MAAYLDDVIVHAKSWEEHLEWLRRVLMELCRAGLTANPRKCHLAMFKAKYLGFQVGRGVVKPHEKVPAILSTPRPRYGPFWGWQDITAVLSLTSPP